MKKLAYETPNMELVRFEAEDVITTSPPQNSNSFFDTNSDYPSR